MKIGVCIAAVLLLLALGVDMAVRGQAPPTDPSTHNSRYVLESEEYDAVVRNQMSRMRDLFKIDTVTGQTWMFVSIDGRVKWTPISTQTIVFDDK